jgi:uncharacterized protein (DUF305 family)
MYKDAAFFGIIGLLAGIILTLAITSLNHNTMMGMTDTNGDAGNHMDMSMDDMMGTLEGKTGDEFDKAFLSSMIEHHQGAVEMAKEAQQNAKHDEIKKMADDIITAQQKEISQMREWQSLWGY